MNINTTKILFLLNAMPDGGGDFSFGSKIVSNLKNMGIKDDNIFVVMKLDDLFINEYLNFNKLFKNNCIDKQSINEDELFLNDKDICTLKKITISICDTYKILYNKEDNNFCYLNRPAETEQQIITYKSDRKKTNFQNINLQNHFEKQIKNIIDKNLKAGRCSIDHNSFLNFYNKFITNDFFKIWITNTIKFFLSVNINTSNFLYISDFKKLTPEKLGFETENISNTLIITFLYVYTLDNFKDYKYINLVEIGDLLFHSYPLNTYTLGFNDDPRSLGVNIVKDFNDISILDLFKETNHFSKIMTNSNYNVCYFGGTTINPSIYNFLMLYKLKAFCEVLDTHNHLKEYNVFIPYNSFIFISKYINISKSVIPTIIIKDIHTLNITTFNKSSINLAYFKELSRDEFINFINKSQDLCVLTGDQSFYEGVSLGKYVIYDVLPHKTFLYKQYLNKLNIFTQTNDPEINDYVNELNFDFFRYSTNNKNILNSEILDINPLIDNETTYDFNSDNFKIIIEDEIVYELNYFDLAMLYDINSSLIIKANTFIDKNGNTFINDLILNNNFDDKFKKIVIDTLNNVKLTYSDNSNDKENEDEENVENYDTDYDTDYNTDYDSHDDSYDDSYNDKYFYKYIKYKHKYLAIKINN